MTNAMREALCDGLTERREATLPPEQPHESVRAGLKELETGPDLPLQLGVAGFEPRTSSSRIRLLQPLWPAIRHTRSSGRWCALVWHGVPATRSALLPQACPKRDRLVVRLIASLRPRAAMLAVLVRVRQNGHAEIVIRITLPTNESDARTRLASVLTHVRTLIGPPRIGRADRAA